MTRIIFFVFIFLAAVVFSFWLLSRTDNPERNEKSIVRINGTKYEVELAKTLTEQKLGLSNRAELKETAGMLFVFPLVQSRDFHMRGMQFPLDFVWIRDGRVVGTTENARPASEIGFKVYPSPEKVDMVLEINAGEVENRKISVGDSMELVVK